MAARQTTVNWGTTGQLPMAVTDPTGATTQLNYDFRYGLPSSRTDPNGLTTAWQYGDGFGRKTQENRPDGTYTIWTYNDCTNAGGCLMGSHTLALTHSVYNTDGSVQTDGTTYFDELERPILANQRMLAAGSYERNEVRYDSLGRVVQQAFPCTWSSVTTTCAYWTTNTFDVLNRVTESQRPISATNSTLQSTSRQYEGRTTIITDANGHARTLIDDVNGRLRQTKDADGYVVTIGYDAAGSKNATSDSQGNALFSASYAYGVGAFMTQMTDADLGTWSYTVDALGEVTGWQDPKGQQFSAAYDALSRMTDRYEPDLYTHWSWGTNASAHEIGQLHSVCTGTGSSPTSCSSATGYAESETYDNVGRLYQRAIQIPGDATYTYTWQYNATTGLLDTLTYPTSTGGYALALKYAYSNGILQSVTDTSDSPHVTLWTADATNPRGQVTEETLGNGLVVSHAFDAVTGWIGAVTAGVGGGSAVQNSSYLFDEVGNLTQRQDNNRGLTENIYPDTLNRISYTTLAGGGYNGTNLALTYDPMGNILTAQVEGATTVTQNFTTNQPGCGSYANTQPHALRSITNGAQVTSFCYDANGNGVSESINGAPYASTSWTSYNQLASYSGPYSNSSQFSYDANHQRYKQVATFPGGTPETTIYVGGLLEKVTNPNGTDYRHYVPVGNSTVVYNRWTNGTNALYYLTTDHLGSTTAITDASGNLVLTENFAASGWRRGDNWTGKPTSAELQTIDGITHRGFTFQERLDNLSLTDFNGRIYGETGEFLSPDPFIPDPTNTQSYNRYTYALNNPLTYTDPSGFDECLRGAYTTIPGPDLNPDFIGEGGTVLSWWVEVPVPDICWPLPTFQPPPSIPPTGPGGGGAPGPTPGAPHISPGHGPQLTPRRQPSSQKTPCLLGTQCYVPQTTPKQPFNSYLCAKTGTHCVQQPEQPPAPPCPNGQSPSVANNPNAGRNMLFGLGGGSATGMVIGGLVVANLAGAPEVELGEGAGAVAVAGVRAWQFLSGFGLEAANTAANGSLLGGALGGSLGMTTGLLATPSTCSSGGN